ncbi:hypothetical protein GCM10027160_49800 [Streptomyces calidiresistens]|uniref:Uncharacterized protein n=1 Tax=Streptomyces calidiresistens TaxID=1485586 RepID=A0A7W3XX63_9ACTN|nr:hypothetical protein [Streptomyces calidiresistens]MBB0230466.1 hypothetical protein [Streptomyces calidiresistens]
MIGRPEERPGPDVGPDTDRLRGALRAAVGDEPPLRLDPDTIVHRGRRRAEGRRVLIASVVATVIVVTATTLLPALFGDPPTGVGPAGPPERTRTAPPEPAPEPTPGPARDGAGIPPRDPLDAEGYEAAAELWADRLRAAVPVALPDTGGSPPPRWAAGEPGPGGDGAERRWTFEQPVHSPRRGVTTLLVTVTLTSGSPGEAGCRSVGTGGAGCVASSVGVDSTVAGGEVSGTRVVPTPPPARGPVPDEKYLMVTVVTAGTAEAAPRDDGEPVFTPEPEELEHLARLLLG